ncbi:hypothetical protein JCGZ_17937 [Jatropha curcas]|uniref:Uncharacterized protein n=1 Tax=Jatropha curcas TaxID=180498 RepID=A0A067K4Q8_JATCU|nr:uncharacterized protein LOC105645001 [Jatropha curcas]KDP26779.1 hypothetical protein JCGZ_17937 [Jatropha curcas]
MSCRRPPLHTCAISLMEIADKAYSKAQNLNGASNSITKMIARLALLASPYVYALEYQLLVIFSFLDNWIFAFESAVEAIFPPSKYAFNKIDDLVKVAEILPGKVDEAVDKFPMMIHQFPFLDLTLIRVISCLNFFISILREWRSGNAKEKEIPVDINCNESETVQEEAFQGIESENLDDGIPEIKQDLGSAQNAGGIICQTYKDALKKGGEHHIRDERESSSKYILEERAEEEEKRDIDEGQSTYKNALEKEAKEENGNKDKEGMTYSNVLENEGKKEENEGKDKGRTTRKKGKRRNGGKERREFDVRKEENGDGGKKKNIEKKKDVVKMEIEEGRTKKKIEKKEDSAKEIKNTKESKANI